MTWRTHITFGLTFTVFGFTILSFPFNPFGIILTAFGALFPDLDASESKIKNLKLSKKKGLLSLIKPFEVFGFILNKTLGHRGALHSLAGLVVFSYIAYFVSSFFGEPLFFIYFSLGFLSHLLSDMLTKSGVEIFYPWKKNFRLLPRRIAIKSNSFFDEALFVVFGFMFVLWFWVYFEESLFKL
ncbi:MAG: metal-dependent hydrolase [Parcubacteria group bacterium]|nr:metal-dependent hydrolase [Parcubacteria group bacterium]